MRDETGDVVGLLRATALFGNLEPDDLRDLAGECEVVTLAAGDALVRAGQAGDTLYTVLSGRLRVTNPGRTAVLAELRHGEHLGDAAVLAATVHTVDVLALVETKVVALSHEHLDSFAARHPSIADEVAAIEERLRRTATQRLRPDRAEVMASLGRFLGGLEGEALAMVEDEVEWVLAPADTPLMRQGDPGDCLWVVVSGRVEVYSERDDGHELRIDEAGPGEALGEMALLSSEPRSASARTLDDSELLRLSQAGFEQLLNEHPATMAMFTRTVVDRLNQRIRARSLVTQLRYMPLVTTQECDEVVCTESLVLRNLRITQMYHRLSLELTLLIGHQDTNWCTFGCNASKTAGYSIRREELPLVAVAELLRRNPTLAAALDRIAGRLKVTRIGERVDGALAAVSETISAGNLKVFAELGPIFADLTTTFYEDREPDRAKLEVWLSKRSPDPTEDGGQQTLIEALTHYYGAMFEPHPKRKSELILLGNLKVGLHEQIRLQPHIADAMDAPMRVGLGGLIGEGVDRRVGRFLPAPAAGRLHHGLDHEEQQVVRWLSGVWRQRLTRNLMTLRLPYGAVRLGSDVPKLPAKTMYPDLLQTLENPELVAFARRFDKDEATSALSRAADWANLDDRMCFILELMRSRQKSLELFDQPFLEYQRAEILHGSVPVGRL